MLGLRRAILLVKLHNRADDLIDLAEDAEADPRLYRDPTWWQRVIGKAADLVSLIPLPPAVHEGIRPVANFLTGATTNWKTSLLGLAAGYLLAFQGGLASGLDAKHAALGALVALLGLSASDHSTVTATDQPAK